MTKRPNEVEVGTAAFARRLLLLAVAMFGFGYLLVPLYDVFCELTGFGGKPEGTAAVVVENVDESRMVTVQFVTTVNEYAPWTFSVNALRTLDIRCKQKQRYLQTESA